MGVVPCLPGFVAAVDPSTSVPAGATELYYLSYIYGFLSSGLVFALLHRIFPSRPHAEFVNQSVSSLQLRRTYRERWDVTLSRTLEILDSQPVKTIGVDGLKVDV